MYLINDATLWGFKARRFKLVNLLYPWSIATQVVEDVPIVGLISDLA